MLRPSILKSLKVRRFSSQSKWLFDNRCSVSKGDLTFGISVDKMGHLSESSVTASYGGSVVHVAVNSQAPAEAGEDFLPLTVDYRARMSAFGLIPEGSRGREKNSDDEILVARFIDRAIRPLFPSGYVQEVQVTATNHATDGVHDPTVLALNATSMALLKSRQPWYGPIGCVRVGLVDNKLVVNPPVQIAKDSPFDLLYAGTVDRTLMIEAVGSQVSESLVKEAIDIAHSAVREIIATQKELLDIIKSDDSDKGKLSKNSGYMIKEEHRILVQSLFGDKARSFYREPLDGKEDRSKAEGILRSTILDALAVHPIISSEPPIVRGMLTDELITKSFREALLEEVPLRTDGRKANEVRQIDCAAGVLSAVHGSSYFARGDTHVISSVTLGNLKNARASVALDGSDNEKIDHFFLHYDFPPYCNGEVGALTLNRRMIGHGNLAERALRRVMPKFENFPYVVRVMAECTSSNGSSSMASACSGTLALLEAGVPLEAPVAGISVGLVTDPSFAAKAEEFASGEMPEGGKYRLLTDILGSEDHHGDMDFKIAGTANGITAIQLDVKLPGGIPLPIIKEALDAGKTARLQILEKMDPFTTKQKLKSFAPRAALIPVDIDRMSHLLANSGEVLKFVTKTYDVEVHITEENQAYIYGKNDALFQEAASLIYDVATVVKQGDIVDAIVVDVKDFGVFVRVNQGQEALLHISQISHDSRINKVPLEELCYKGQKLNVKITVVDEVSGLVQVSRKALLDSKTPDALFDESAQKSATIDDNFNQFASLTAKFPMTPARKWSPDYYRNSAASEQDIAKALAQDQGKESRPPVKTFSTNKKQFNNNNNSKNSPKKASDNGNLPNKQYQTKGKSHQNDSNRKKDASFTGQKQQFRNNEKKIIQQTTSPSTTEEMSSSSSAVSSSPVTMAVSSSADISSPSVDDQSSAISPNYADAMKSSKDTTTSHPSMEVSLPSVDEQYSTISTEIADAVESSKDNTASHPNNN